MLHLSLLLLLFLVCFLKINAKLSAVQVSKAHGARVSDNKEIHGIATAVLSTKPIRRRTAALSIVLPWLYFLCTSMQLTTLPTYVNWALNEGSMAVSPRSAQVYGNMQGLDALFTFLSVSFVGCLSDIYGRAPFMMMSCLGLAASYTTLIVARTPNLFYLASAIDGLTSCMLSQGQV